MNLRKEIRKTIREQTFRPTKEYYEIQNTIDNIKEGLDRFVGLLPSNIFQGVGDPNLWTSKDELFHQIKSKLRTIQVVINDLVESVDR